MNVYQEAYNDIDDFLKKNVSCKTCAFFTPDLFDGGDCENYEFPKVYLPFNYSNCEIHEFRDSELQKQLEVLQEKWVNAWQIVEGFMY